ncbi:WXG100 family type VII secretion target [Nocardia sp. NPDC020380]|uniref:WXG100 family type VII secretion target n=1 Tax=Nocardia sp. NPDC020380 TaxID=3364309 RepID=UPI00379F9E74
MTEGEAGPTLSVVPDDVRAIGAYAYDLAGTLRQALTSAAREVDALTGKSWTGTAADSFADGWSEVHTSGTEILNTLTTLARALGVTADTYTTQDTRFATEFTTLDLP